MDIERAMRGKRKIASAGSSMVRNTAIAAGVVGVCVIAWGTMQAKLTKAQIVSTDANGSLPSCPLKGAELSAQDLEVANVAWGYFERNIQPNTGLVNAVDHYPSTTMWDTASTLAAFLAADELSLIDSDTADRYINNLLNTLEQLDLFNEEAPNKVYQTATGQMADYRNRPVAAGVGVSTLDLGRLVSWLSILTCLRPESRQQVLRIIERWSFCRLVDKGQMYGLARDNTGVIVLQEGRLGYEQYAGKALRNLGLDLSVSSNYQNRFAKSVKVDGVSIAADTRDANNFGAHNYVVAESYAMDVLEHGLDTVNSQLFDNIYWVQQQRFEKTGTLTAVSEDNIDRTPYFVYNTIFTNNKPWHALTDRGEDMAQLKTLSTKAALSMAYLKPNSAYSSELLEGISQARNPAGGWYSGVYERDGSFNTATTANTNGVILSLLLYKKFGSLSGVCGSCEENLQLSTATLQQQTSEQYCKKEISRRSSAANKAAQLRQHEWVRLDLERGIEKIEVVLENLDQAKKNYRSGDSKAAFDALSIAKRGTWSASSTIASEKKNLHSFMRPFDRLKTGWKNGDDSPIDQLTVDLQAVVDRLALRLESLSSLDQN